jgi:hypothetical protein
MKNFGHIFNFVRAKEMLEPMRPLVSSLQGRLVEVYFGFKKIEDVINFYNDIRNEITHVPESIKSFQAGTIY